MTKPPVVLLAILLSFLSCSGHKPQIAELRWRLNIQFTPRPKNSLKDSSTIGSEALSLFIRPIDYDGIEDLDSLYLINHEADLFWALNADQWQNTTNAGIFWVGSNQFNSGYLKQLPRGEYWVQLYDKAGEFAQRNFQLIEPNTQLLASQITVPTVGDELLLLLPEDVSLYSIVGYDVANNILFTDANYQSLISLKKLKARNDELDKVQISFIFPNSNVMALLGPYLVPRMGTENQQPSIQQKIQQKLDGQRPKSSKEPEIAIDTYIPTKEEIEAANNH